MVSLFNRLFSSLATLNGPLSKNKQKKENAIKKPEYGRREEREQVAVYFDAMGFPSRRGRDVIGQGLAVLTNQRLVRPASPLIIQHPVRLCGECLHMFCDKHIKRRTLVNTPSHGFETFMIIFANLLCA